MLTRSLTRLGVTVGGLALTLTAAAGIASADPDYGPMINTTCTYDQAVAALSGKPTTPKIGTKFTIITQANLSSAASQAAIYKTSC